MMRDMLMDLNMSLQEKSLLQETKAHKQAPLQLNHNRPTYTLTATLFLPEFP